MNTVRISETLQKALNDQVTLEAYSAQMYLMLACWADENQLDGVKDFMYPPDEPHIALIKKLI